MNTNLKHCQCIVYGYHGHMAFALNSQTILSENETVRMESTKPKELRYRKPYLFVQVTKIGSGNKDEVKNQRPWVSEISVISAPAGSWKRHAGTGWILCGCWKTRKHRITLRSPGFGPGGAGKLRKTCSSSTSMFGSWRKWARRIINLSS